GRPGHDVDALATEFVDDRLDAGTLEPDAGADRIDGIVTRNDGDLGPTAGLARDAADLDDALLNLGDLELEQGLHEQRIGARQDEARTLRCLFQPLEDATDRVALMEPLAMILL